MVKPSWALMDHVNKYLSLVSLRGVLQFKILSGLERSESRPYMVNAIIVLPCAGMKPSSCYMKRQHTTSKKSCLLIYAKSTSPVLGNVVTGKM
jgi:hypothetical protein